MGSRTSRDEEYADGSVDEDDDIVEAPRPSRLPRLPAPPVAWSQPLRTGAVPPSPLVLPDGGVRLLPTRSYQFLRLRALAVSVALSILLPLGVLAVITRGDLTVVPVAFYGWFALMAGIVTVSSLRAPAPKLLSLDADGITYDHDAYVLKAGWAAVEAIVQIGDKPEALAVRLAVPSAAWERPDRRAPWRKAAFPWDRTVPLFPFLRGDDEQTVLRHIAAAAPRLQGVPATVEGAVAQPTDRRIAAGAIAIVPAVVLDLAFGLTQGLSTFSLGFNTVLVSGYMLAVLARRRGVVGERVVDFAARVLLDRQGPERPIAVLRTLGGAYAGFAFFVAVGFGLAAVSPGNTMDTLAAKYGPAHSCWQTDQGEITGCRLSTGEMLGSVGVNPTTCFFSEPVPETTTTLHCSH
ncbi:MAG: hypothetical protein ACYDAN_15500 [Candidatus Limnocylindrales bacterium]